ncbi:MAG: JAB domain-containing protein, partial [Chlorobiaceae bacterium]|nr:JAB domain-containing protein [Chlorobiaceae bacterium]
VIDAGEVFRGALLAGAQSIILATVHNSDNPKPSIAEREKTKILMEAGDLLKIRVLEHVIIASNKDCYSFRTASREQE